MTKPDKPIEAQGLGCGLVISLAATAFTISYWFGLSPEASTWIAGILAAISLLGYAVNQSKSQQILDQEHKRVTAQRDEVPCGFCAEPILREAKKCKHCGEMQ